MTKKNKSKLPPAPANLKELQEEENRKAKEFLKEMPPEKRERLIEMVYWQLETQMKMPERHDNAKAMLEGFRKVVDE